MQKNFMKVATGLPCALILAAVVSSSWSGAVWAETGHEHMSHEQMDHSTMDHSKMDHSKMDHSKMDHTTMDHSKMGGDAQDHTQHQAMLDQRGVLSLTAKSYTIPDIKLTDSNGRAVALRSLLDGKEPVILNFIFTTCTTICPVMSSTFEQVQEQLGSRRNRVRLVSVSIDPENDTPAKLKAYAHRYNAGPHWQLLTGSVANSFAVQNAFEVAVGDKMNHKPLAFIRARGRDAGWVRMDGLVGASDIINELNRLESVK